MRTTFGGSPISFFRRAAHHELAGRNPDQFHAGGSGHGFLLGGDDDGTGQQQRGGEGGEADSVHDFLWMNPAGKHIASAGGDKNEWRRSGVMEWWSGGVVRMSGLAILAILFILSFSLQTLLVGRGS